MQRGRKSAAGNYDRGRLFCACAETRRSHWGAAAIPGTNIGLWRSPKASSVNWTGRKCGSQQGQKDDQSKRDQSEQAGQNPQDPKERDRASNPSEPREKRDQPQR